jgi:CBS domain-containing protein
MQRMKVKDFMTPVGDFPRISEETSFGEAVLALEKAQEDFQAGRSKQRIVLVENDKGHIVGKLSPTDLLRGLEPQYESVAGDYSRSRGLASSYSHFMQTAFEKTRFWVDPIDDLCTKAVDVKIKNFLRRITEPQTVNVEDSLDNALHAFILGRHDALFVVKDGTLKGILRFSDVYREIKRIIKTTCDLET